MKSSTPAIEGHLSHSYDAELDNLRSKILEMSWLVEQQLSDALDALIGGNANLAEQILVKERLVDRMEIESDELCSRVIARRQPIASDLRYVISVTKTADALECIGDEIEQVALIALDIADSKHEHDFEEIAALGEHVQETLNAAMIAFSESNVDKAIEVLNAESKVSKKYEKLTLHIIESIDQGASPVAETIKLLWAIKALRDIADKTRNIGDHVIYFARGKDVRHASVNKARKVAKSKP